jgi:hypothetical protein
VIRGSAGAEPRARRAARSRCGVSSAPCLPWTPSSMCPIPIRRGGHANFVRRVHDRKKSPSLVLGEGRGPLPRRSAPVDRVRRERRERRGKNHGCRGRRGRPRSGGLGHRGNGRPRDPLHENRRDGRSGTVRPPRASRSGIRSVGPRIRTARYRTRRRPPRSIPRVIGTPSSRCRREASSPAPVRKGTESPPGWPRRRIGSTR